MAAGGGFAASWLFLLILGGPTGLPVLSVPPLPEDPVLSRAAPEECMAYFASAGRAEPRADSSNHTERLCAEPEIQALGTQLQRMIRDGMARQKSRDPAEKALAEEGPTLVKALLTRPLAFYLADVKPDRDGPPEVRGGVVLSLGEQAEKLTASLERCEAALPKDRIKEVTIDGTTFRQMPLDPKGPQVTWGVKGKYFYAAVGEGELKALLGRAEGETPKWLTALRKRLPVERVASISRLDIEKLIARLGPMGGPQAARVLKATGLDSLQELSSVAGLDKEGFASRNLIRFRGEPKGLLKLLDQKPLTADDLAIIPRDATLAVAKSADLKKVYDQVLEVVKELHPQGVESYRENLGRLEEQLGVKLNDLLESLGDRWYVYDSPGEGGLLTGLTLVASLKDADAARKVHDRLHELLTDSLKRQEQQQPPGGRRRGPRLSKLSFERQTIHVLNPDGDAPVAPSWCITDKHLVVALYPSSVKAFLSRGKEFRSLGEVAPVKAALGEGQTLAVIYTDTRRLFDLVYPILNVLSEALVNQLRREGMDVPPGLLPSAASIRRHLRPSLTTVERSRDGLEIVSHQSVPGSVALNSLPLSIGLLLPAVQKVREAAARTQSSNNLKQIGLAMHSYHDTYGSFPPAYTASKDGKPLLSWRVHILPFIEQNNLYKQFHLDEPWDSPHNKKLIERMPKVYRSPGSQAAPGMTTYLTIRGENTAFPGAKGVKLSDIPDGTSNTIMTVEASDQKAVVWTKPDDLPLNEKKPHDGLRGPWPAGFLAGMCDGSVRMVGFGISRETLLNAFLRNDGNPLGPDW